MGRMENRDEFALWLRQEMARREWRPADLARKSGLSTGFLSKLLKGERRAGIDACRMIARALGMQDIEVLRHAGLAEPEPSTDSPMIRQLIFEFSQLEPDEQEQILKILRALNAMHRGMIAAELPALQSSEVS